MSRILRTSTSRQNTLVLINHIECIIVPYAWRLQTDHQEADQEERHLLGLPDVPVCRRMPVRRGHALDHQFPVGEGRLRLALVPRVWSPVDLPSPLGPNVEGHVPVHLCQRLWTARRDDGRSNATRLQRYLLPALLPASTASGTGLKLDWTPSCGAKQAKQDTLAKNSEKVCKSVIPVHRCARSAGV